jgi:hypothetical protein
MALNHMRVDAGVVHGSEVNSIHMLPVCVAAAMFNSKDKCIVIPLLN